MLTEVRPCNALLAAGLGGRAQNLAAESHTARKHTATPHTHTHTAYKGKVLCVCVLHVTELKVLQKGQTAMFICA